MYLDHTERGKGNFRRVAGIVKTICGMNLALKRYIHKDKVIRWVAHHQTRKADTDKKLLFNIHNFTKSKSERESAKLKSLLSVLPHERSVHDISLIQSLLHKNQAFQAMPHIVQLEICQAAVYQQYEAKTTVVRKGHQPEACYFVVNGKLVAKSSDGCSKSQHRFTEILNEIEEGDLFGDGALLTRTTRPTTILCKTKAELLLINKEFGCHEEQERFNVSGAELQETILFLREMCRHFGEFPLNLFLDYNFGRTSMEILLPYLCLAQDFESILARFLEQRYSVITDLLGSLPIFTSWTIEKLTLLSHSSLLRHYRSGTAVVPESCNSFFIVVVKSGRCYMVTNLIMDQHGKVQAQKPRPKKSSVLLKDLPMPTLLKRETKVTGKSPQRVPASPSFGTGGLQDATKTERTQKSRSTEMATPTHLILPESSFEELEHEGLEEHLSIGASGSKQDLSIEESEPLRPTSGNSSATVHIPEDTNNEPEEMEPCKTEHTDESPSTRSAKSMPERVISSVEDGNETQETAKLFGHNEDNGQNKERKKILLNPSQEYPRLTFVKIGSLEQGGIFGLTEIPGSTCKLQLSLVSDGAECIFVPKKLFLGEAPEKSRQVALELVTKYPDEQTIRENFAREQEWSLYKAQLMRQLLGSHAKQSSVSVNLGMTTF